MSIDPTGKLPPYRQLAAIIEKQINDKTFESGARLPTESELMEQYELGRSTVRRAIAYLREAGLVETVPQRGTYVL